MQLGHRKEWGEGRILSPPLVSQIQMHFDSQAEHYISNFPLKKIVYCFNFQLHSCLWLLTFSFALEI